MDIHVTEEHIRLSKGDVCPVTLALLGIVKLDKYTPVVTLWSIEFKFKGTNAKAGVVILPSEVRLKLAAYYTNKLVEPFSFSVDIPERFLA